MLRLGIALGPQYSAGRTLSLPSGFGWDSGRFPLEIVQNGAGRTANLTPRELVDPRIWSGVALHVDEASGNDGNSGLGAQDGDFSAAKRNIWAAFVAGNATGAPYRVIVKPGFYAESEFTRNGNDEPSQPVAVIGWGGAVRYRTGPWSVTWSAESGTYTAPESAVRRVLRADSLSPEGHYGELDRAATLAACQATVGTWFPDGGTLHVNIGTAPGAEDIAVIRGFHGARFLTHTDDLYLENIHCEGGITGALHCDAVASRNIVGVNCSFRYSGPNISSQPQDAVRVRRTNGLIAFFDSDASMGAKDGWNFHEDGTSGMHVLLERCTGHGNGIDLATSCNAFTTHDGVRSIVFGGHFGMSRNGTEVHCIQDTQTWLAGVSITANDPDGSSVALKCSGEAEMWLEDCIVNAFGGVSNLVIEANGGTVYTRRVQAISGDTEISSGGAVVPF